MNRKLFCNISPFTYKISTFKCRFMRHIKNLFLYKSFANKKSDDLLSVVIYKHNSLIRRKLGNVNMNLQENKYINLSLATPKINKILIQPGQTFSFWHLLGDCSFKKGYKDGLVISLGKPSHGIGGGMCQFTNLIHWMVLHTSMEIIEHHHHDQIDLFPDFNRQIPFGTGTSILYNYLDYQFKNNTHITYQLITYINDKYLCGEIRANKPQKYSYHIVCENEFFSKEDDGIYRNNKIYRKIYNRKTGNLLEKQLLKNNHAKVAYEISDYQFVDLTI